MNYCPVIYGQVTDRLQTEYDAYEPSVHVAQVGSKYMAVSLPTKWCLSIHPYYPALVMIGIEMMGIPAACKGASFRDSLNDIIGLAMSSL